MIKQIQEELKSKASPSRAKLLSGYFKTGKGQYAEGDVFLGLTSEQIKDIAKKYYNSSFDELQILLNSKIHEERVLSLRVLIHQFKKADDLVKLKIFNFYLINTKNINNWDLVDMSAPKIVGEYLKNKDRKVLYKLAKSQNLWEKRISVLSTFAFIRDNDFFDALEISEIHIKDTHDLMHKAVGWMLREIGKKDIKVLEKFLSKHYKYMPRTMLRYAIEKFPESKRKSYLKGEI